MKPPIATKVTIRAIATSKDSRTGVADAAGSFMDPVSTCLGGQSLHSNTLVA